MWHRARAWAKALVGRSRMESEMDAEMRFHIEARAEDLERGGMEQAEALRRARVEFGGLEKSKDECRDARGVSLVDNLLRDLRFGARMLSRNPGFSITAVLTLALGIGANTAIFSVVNAVLLRPLPYKDADRLVTVWSDNRTRGFSTELVSPLDFADWQAENQVFEGLAASTDVSYTLTGSGEPVQVTAYSFSADYFRLLGVRPMAGRTFLEEEEQPGKNHVVVLSYSFWQSHFGGDRNLLHREITLDGAPYTVVGVMPPQFRYPPRTEMWTPLSPDPQAAGDRAYRYLRVLGRLKPGVPMDRARVEMNGIAGRLAAEYAATNKEVDAVNLIPLRETISGDVRPALIVLFAAVGLVMLIACANVANLLLTRAAAREREVAMRGTLGASRNRLVRQFLTESVLLAMIGGLLGMLLAGWSTQLLVVMFSTGIANLSIPHLEKIPMDAWVLVFTLAMSLATGILFGVAPALRSSLVGNEQLKESGRGLTASLRWRRFRNVLVVSELAMSIVLLTAAGLTLKSFFELLAGDLGFQPEHVLTLRVMLPSSKYAAEAQVAAFGEQVLERIRALPGVQAAGTVTFLPLSGWYGNRTVAMARDTGPRTAWPTAVWSSATPDYFRAMGIPLIKGRFFTDADRRGAPAVAILSKSLAHQLSASDDPIGKQIEVQGVKGPVEIVGEVGDVRQLGVMAEMAREVYLPFAQLPAPILCFALRTAGPLPGLSQAARSAIWAVDKDQSVGFVMDMDELVSDSVAPERVVATVLGTFAGLALLMASIGVYGVIENSAQQRTREIGIRMALGARAGEILRDVMSQGWRLVLAGSAIGVVAALALMRFISSVLYGVRPADPAAFVAATLLLLGVALGACWIPARRATRVEPMVALRYE
jgi:predicted permease